jgi:hypothetical protein
MIQQRHPLQVCPQVVRLRKEGEEGRNDLLCDSQRCLNVRMELFMKKFLVFCVILFLFVPFAGAAPIQYDVNGPGSSVSLWNNTTDGPWGSATITESMAAGLDGESGWLNDGETIGFDFFDLTVSSTGFFSAGQYNISATLAFTLPDVTATGSGGGLFGNVFGVINFGTLHWDPASLPDEFVLSDGTVFSVNFENGIALGCGDTATVHAYISNLGVRDIGTGSTPVSEPGNLVLMGTCLVGLAGVSRMRFFKK